MTEALDHTHTSLLHFALRLLRPIIPPPRIDQRSGSSEASGRFTRRETPAPQRNVARPSFTARPWASSNPFSIAVEKLAGVLATGKTADAAYILAGYRANRSNAARLSASRDIQKRIAEIQPLGAERAAITVETLIAEAEAARSKAMGEKGGAAAATAAITAKAKLAGLWREKIAQTDPSGENVPRYILSERPLTEGS